MRSRGLLVLLLLAVACGGPAGLQSTSISGQPTQVWTVKGSTRAVVWLHGAGRSEKLLGAEQAGLVKRLHRAGWIVASDAAHLDAWGNAASVADYKALIGALRTRYGVRQVVLVAGSMGTLPALQLLRDRVADRLIAVSPVTNLNSVYRVAALRSSAEPRLGAQPPASDDPQTWPADTFRGDQVTLIASPADPLVPFADNALAFSQRFGVPLIQCRGGHLDRSCFDAVRL